MQPRSLHTTLIKKLRTLPRTGQQSPDQNPNVNAAKQEFEALKKRLEQSGDILSTYKAQLDLLGGSYQNLQHGLSLLSAQQEDYNKKIVNLVKNVTLFDQVEKSIAKTLGITTKQSFELSKSTDSYLNSLRISRDELDKYRSTLNKILPLQAKNLGSLTDYNSVLFESQQLLQDFQGLTADQAAAYTLYTEGAGKNIASQLTATQNLAKFWETTTGQVGAFNAILTEIGSLSADIRSEYSRIPGNLELAVLKSKALGMSMAELDSIGTSLLDIEQSVGKEIEFQLISGRRLVDIQGRSLTNRYREAKALGDGVKMTEVMNDLFETQGDLIEKGSYYDKKALADALGIEVQSLVLAKEKYELNKKLAASQKQTFEQFNALTGEQQAKIQLEYENALKKDGSDVATEQLKAIQALKTKENDLKPPADRTAMYLQSIVDNGIALKKGTYNPFESKTFADTIAQSFSRQITESAVIAGGLGYSQTLTKLINADTALVTNIGKLIPGVDLLVNKITELVGRLKGFMPTVGTGKVDNKDAVIVNDGIVRFHPSDKFMRVNDSTMIAGTSIDGNKKLATALAGGGMDMGKLVQAIQTAFAGVKVTVNVDPMQIDREIKFRTATINV